MRSATSCGCMPSTSKEITPPRSVRAGRADRRARPAARRGAPARSAVSSRSCARTRSMPERARGSRRRRRGRRPRRSSRCPPRTSRAGRSTSTPGGPRARIMSPPPRNGRMASRISRRPCSTPMPGRAERLVAGPGVEVGVDRAEVDRQLRDAPARRRSSASAPAAWTRATISATGLIVPSTLETCAKAAMPHAARRELGVELVERERARRRRRRGSAARRRSPGRAAARARCWSGAPSAVMSTTSPARTCSRPQA